jgi:predicted metal-dependent hydrolase
MAFTPPTPDETTSPMLALKMAMDARRRAELPAAIVPAETATPPAQLAFPFAKSQRGEEPGQRARPSRSRRALRTDAPGRRVRSPVLEERPLEEIQLEQCLQSYLPAGRSLRVRLTDNRYTMVMVRRAPERYTVRLHRMFASAEPRLARAIARYVVFNDARASAVIGAFIEKHQHVIRQRPRRTPSLVMRPLGAAHDLQVIFDRLNVLHFAGQLQARITWGSAPRRVQPRRSIKMGSFAVEDRIIRIHPVLDAAHVPEYFVAWIVFHEMLHGKYEVVRRGGRRCFHSKDFLSEERTFPDYERACAWERANIDRLLGG